MSCMSWSNLAIKEMVECVPWSFLDLAMAIWWEDLAWKPYLVLLREDEWEAMVVWDYL